MATTTKPADTEIDVNEQLVEYTAPFAADPHDREIFVAVNGENVRIMRGETVMIKRKFVKVLRDAAQQEREAYLARQRAAQG